MGAGARLILWTGPKHSGKTTAAAELARRLRAWGFKVSGLLAPSVYEGDALVGFDALDLSTGWRLPLLRRPDVGESATVGAFVFVEEGRRVAQAALADGATGWSESKGMELKTALQGAVERLQRLAHAAGLDLPGDSLDVKG